MSKIIKEYWAGKAILITGASSGIGWALAEALAPLNVHLGFMSRRQEKMEELADSLRYSNSRIWIRACDVQNRDAVTAAVNDFAKAAGRIDAVWLNSGVSIDSYYKSWQWDAVDAMFKTNLMGAIYTAKACIDIMAEQKSGAIIGVGSAASMRGLPKRGIYSLTKIGLAYYLESLATELPFLQTTMIHPGYIDTPINAGNANRFWLLQPEKAAKMMLQAVARKKLSYIFPWQMALLYRFVQAVPNRLYVKLAARMMHLSRPDLNETKTT